MRCGGNNYGAVSDCVIKIESQVISPNSLQNRPRPCSEYWVIDLLELTHVTSTALNVYTQDTDIEPITVAAFQAAVQLF